MPGKKGSLFLGNSSLSNNQQFFFHPCPPSTGSKDGAVVRGLVSHNLSRVEIPASTPCMGVEVAVGSLPCSERVSTGTTVIPSPQKSTFPNSSSTRNHVYEEPL